MYSGGKKKMQRPARKQRRTGNGIQFTTEGVSVAVNRDVLRPKQNRRGLQKTRRGDL